MRRRRSAKVKLDTKLIVDVAGAALMVNNLPRLINSFVALDPMISKVAAVGGTYFLGSMLKRPALSNAGIAVGIVEIVDPFIGQLLGTVPSAPLAPVTPTPGISPNVDVDAFALQDFVRLNDYTNQPGSRMSYDAYARSYAY